MRVVTDTDAELVIEDRPWLAVAVGYGCPLSVFAAIALPNDEGTGSTVVAAIVALAVMAVVWWYIPFQRLSFHRAEGVLRRVETRPFSTRLHHLHIDGIERARQEAEWSDTSRTTRLVLEIDGQVVPLARSFGPGSDDAVADAINEWLTRPVGHAPGRGAAGGATAGTDG